MSEWREVALGEVLDVHNRRRIPLSGAVRAARPGPYRYFGAQGVIDHVDDYIFDGEFILVAEDGENLRSRKQPIARLASGRFWANNHVHIVSARPNVADNQFLFYAINNLPLGGRVTGAAQPKLTKDNLQQLTVSCPSFRSQGRIAAVLAAFDELIEINERRIELLEDLARSLYREWFARFRFPGHEAVEFVDSELGPIPERWEALRLGEIAQLRYGRSLPATKRRPGSFAVVSSAGVVGEHDDALVEGPGIVLGRKGNVGSVWWLDDDFFPIDTTYYVTSDLPLGFLYWQLSDLQFDNSHAAVPGLSRDHANSLLVIRPDQATVRRFGEHHMRVFNAIAVLSAQSEALIATRDLLLPRLVTGRVDISDVDLGELLPPEPA
jgi:type I restriction enzyme S subunit